MLALQWLVPEPPIIIQQLLLAGTALGLQLMFPIVTLRVLDLFAHARGAATSAHSFCVLMCGAVVMGLLSPWLSVSMERLALTAFAANLAGWLVWRLARRHQRALGAAAAAAGAGTASS
jgi:DHA1 family bicyclomycin/chloramphenicol resistance-like MFS transporter